MEETCIPVPFILDDKPYHVFCVNAPTLTATAMALKLIANVNGWYQLFQDIEGQPHDRALSDSEAVIFKKEGPNVFYSVPPATFGG